MNHFTPMKAILFVLEVFEMRNMIIAFILFLALCFAGCVGNGQEADTAPIQQENTGSSEQTSAEQVTDRETDASSGIPNEADDDYTKRY